MTPTVVVDNRPALELLDKTLDQDPAVSAGRPPDIQSLESQQKANEIAH